VQTLAQEDIEAFLAHAGRTLKVQEIRKLSFVALKAAKSTRRIYAACIFIDLDFCL